MIENENFKTRTEWTRVPKEMYTHMNILTDKVRNSIKEELARNADDVKVERRYKSLEEEKQDMISGFFHCQVRIAIVFRDEPNEDWILVVKHTNTGFGINVDPINIVENSEGATMLYGDNGPNLVPHGVCVLRVSNLEDIKNKAIGACLLRLYTQQEKGLEYPDSNKDGNEWHDNGFKIVYGDVSDAKKYIKEELDEEENEYDYYNLCRRGRYEANSRMEGLRTVLDLMNGIMV